VLGEPDFVDHVHLSIDDYRLMALAIIGKMSALGMARTGPGWDESAAVGNPVVTEVAQRVMSKMGPHELGEGLHNLAKVVNWAGKHEDAARIAERALATDSWAWRPSGAPFSWEPPGNARAGRRRPFPTINGPCELDPSNSMSRHYLADALLRLGSKEEAAVQYAVVAEQDPTDADAQAKLGMLLVGLGRPAEAVPHLKEALNQFPNARTCAPPWGTPSSIPAMPGKRKPDSARRWNAIPATPAP